MRSESPPTDEAGFQRDIAQYRYGIHQKKRRLGVLQQKLAVLKHSDEA